MAFDFESFEKHNVSNSERFRVHIVSTHRDLCERAVRLWLFGKAYGPGKQANSHERNRGNEEALEMGLWLSCKAFKSHWADDKMLLFQMLIFQNQRFSFERSADTRIAIRKRVPWPISLAEWENQMKEQWW